MRVAKQHLADDFLGARVVKIEPFLAVRCDEFAVDVDAFNAVHGDSLKVTRGLRRQGGNKGSNRDAMEV